MTSLSTRIAALLFCFAAVSQAAPVLADIYRYLDKDGVWHFTNIKPDTRYQLYIRTPQKKTIKEAIKDYDTVIRQASDKFGVDPLLVKAVIKAESDFDHRAVSSKGAKGLMQLMPETADYMDVGDVFDPAENIFGGTRYLSVLLKRFNDDKRLALAGYNAGPERVAAHGGIPPIAETETFVKRVLEYYNSFLASRR
ncbi:MAG: lytic transglycosylase domain-containing protein [Desulfobacteraceae bacterium]|jgi:soluble lytic murein transglycosylase|nr:MAG: lytic transglycosylase domain-containing protein [Desulfobacteraceae bacterium]